jgi:hypothetical protein
MNPYYSFNNYPANSQDARAVDLRAELAALEDGFDKLPTLSSHALELILVNAAGTALAPIGVGKYLMGASWMPVLTCVTPGDLAVVYSVQIGSIHRVGQLILLQWDILTSTFTRTTAAGAVIISGVPIISNNAAAFPGPLSYQGITKANYTQYSPAIGTSGNTLQIDASGSAQALVSLAITDMPSGGTVRLKGSLAYYGQS